MGIALDTSLLDSDGEPVEPVNSLVSHDFFDSIMSRYAFSRRKVESISNFITSVIADDTAIRYFFDGNLHGHNRPFADASQIFALEGAIKALDASYWTEVINLSDMQRLMPAAKRNEWQTSIHEHKTPPFTEENVRATLLNLAAQRGDFFAEKVDGVFRSLSREHVTNRPEGFSKTLITYVHYGDGYILSSYGHVENVQDLRSVVATLMQRDEPYHWATKELLDNIQRTKRLGQWVRIDGGALEVKLYKKGTLHIRCHQDIAWQLNKVLAKRYPAAIPSELRSPPQRRPGRRYATVEQPLPFAVLQQLDTASVYQNDGVFAVLLSSATKGPLGGLRHVSRLVREALLALGGVLDSQQGRVIFDFDPRDLIAGLVERGTLPEQRSHQFYPTPEALAKRVVEMAQIEPESRILEPSAGVGNIARLLPTEQTQCVELAPLHCEALRQRGLVVDEADFLLWASKPEHQQGFDRIVANPPFADGRAQAHMDAMMQCLAPRGRLIAILPASMRQRWRPAANTTAYVTWSEEISGAFPGVSIDVVIAQVSRH